MSRLAHVGLLMLALMACGCRAAASRDFSVDHRIGQQTETRTVPYSATFALHPISPSDGLESPLSQVELVAGRQIGFVTTSSGTLTAYAGGQKFPLQEGRYAWRCVPGSRLAVEPVSSTNAERLDERLDLNLGGIAQGTLGAAAAIMYALASSNTFR